MTHDPLSEVRSLIGFNAPVDIGIDTTLLSMKIGRCPVTKWMLDPEGNRVPLELHHGGVKITCKVECVYRKTGKRQTRRFILRDGDADFAEHDCCRDLAKRCHAVIRSRLRASR